MVSNVGARDAFAEARARQTSGERSMGGVALEGGTGAGRRAWVCSVDREASANLRLQRATPRPDGARWWRLTHRWCGEGGGTSPSLDCVIVDLAVYLTPHLISYADRAINKAINKLLKKAIYSIY